MSSDYTPGVSADTIETLKVERKVKTLADLCRQFHVSEVFSAKVGKLVTVTNDTSMLDTFRTLKDNGYLSVPVYDKKHHRYDAFFDLVDVVTFVVDTVKNDDLCSSSSNLMELIQTTEALDKATARQVAGLSERNPFKGVEHSAPVSAVINLMAKWGVHRVAILDSDSDLESVLTQSQVTRFLHDNMSLLPADFLQKTVADLQIGFKDVVQCKPSDKVIDAFRTIVKNKVSSIAVVDGDSKLVGNLSATDLKHTGLDEGLLKRLFVTVEEFTQQHTSAARPDSEIVGPVAVKASTTMEEALVKMVMSRVHRMYIVDDEGVPVGVISQLEILRAVNTLI